MIGSELKFFIMDTLIWILSASSLGLVRSVLIQILDYSGVSHIRNHFI